MVLPSLRRCSRVHRRIVDRGRASRIRTADPLDRSARRPRAPSDNGGAHLRTYVINRTSSRRQNQPGAAGLIGTERVARAAPDGYTIGGFQTDSIMTMLPTLREDAVGHREGFEPVSARGHGRVGTGRSNNGAVHTAAELMQPLRRVPARSTTRRAAMAARTHRDGVVRLTAGITLTHVPYKGATQAATTSRADR